MYSTPQSRVSHGGCRFYLCHNAIVARICQEGIFVFLITLCCVKLSTRVWSTAACLSVCLSFCRSLQSVCPSASRMKYYVYNFSNSHPRRLQDLVAPVPCRCLIQAARLALVRGTRWTLCRWRMMSLERTKNMWVFQSIYRPYSLKYLNESIRPIMSWVLNFSTGHDNNSMISFSLRFVTGCRLSIIFKQYLLTADLFLIFWILCFSHLRLKIGSASWAWR